MLDNAKPKKPKTADDMAHDFIAIREARKRLLAEYNKADEGMKAVQEKIKSAMLGLLNKQGAEGIRTQYGTFFKKLEIKPHCHDWESFYRWVRENDTFEFLEKRVTKSQVSLYMEEHGEPPPGVTVHKEYDVGVRKNGDQ